MKNLFTFLAKLIAVITFLAAALVGIGYFLDKKTKFFRDLFSKKSDGTAEE